LPNSEVLNVELVPNPSRQREHTLITNVKGGGNKKGIRDETKPSKQLNKRRERERKESNSKTNTFEIRNDRPGSTKTGAKGGKITRKSTLNDQQNPIQED